MNTLKQKNFFNFTKLIFLSSIILFSVHSNAEQDIDEELKEVFLIANDSLSKIQDSPIEDPCLIQNEKDEEIPNEEEISEDSILLKIGYPISPSQVFTNTPNYFTEFRLKNDAFAIPLDILRYGEPVIFDEGETHGVEIRASFLRGEYKYLTLSYETNLYTDSSYEKGPSGGYLQTFTNEQLYYASFDNLSSADSFTYKVDFGVVGLNGDNDTSLCYASTQQRLLHNGLDEKILKCRFYDVENVLDSSKNEHGGFLKMDVGKSFNFVNSSNTLGAQSRIYLAPEISTIIPISNLEVGISGDLFLGLQNNPYDQFIIFGDVTIPRNALGFHLGVDAPVSVHQVSSENETKVGYSFKPSIETGVRFWGLEASYKLQMNNGSLPNYIPENYKYSQSLNGQEVYDQGDMGEAYIRAEIKF